MHRAAIVRTVGHKAGCHNPLPTFTGLDLALTDFSNPNPNHPPSMGSVCEYLKKDQGGMPAYVCLPTHLGYGEAARRPGIYGGYLGQRYDPFISEVDPTPDPACPEPCERGH